MVGTIVLETNRLILRGYLPSDRDAFVALNCDLGVREKMNGALSLESAFELFQRIVTGADRNSVAWAIDEKLSRESAASDQELGFLFFQTSWGRGFATETVKRLLDHCSCDAFCSRVYATVDIDHARSIRVLQKAGFEREAMQCDDDDPDTPYYVFAKYFGE